MVTDNIVQSDYADALAEAPESEEEMSSSIEKFIKKANSNELDILRESLSNFDDMIAKEKEEGSDDEYQEDFEEIEEDLNEDHSSEEEKIDDEVDEVIEEYASDDDDFDRQIE